MIKSKAKKGQTYLCGCGETFTASIQFKTHNTEKHANTFIDGSSHYLSAITMIVLPVRLNMKQRRNESNDCQLIKNAGRIIKNERENANEDTENEQKIIYNTRSKLIPTENKVRHNQIEIDDGQRLQQEDEKRNFSQNFIQAVDQYKYNSIDQRKDERSAKLTIQNQKSIFVVNNKAVWKKTISNKIQQSKVQKKSVEINGNIFILVPQSFAVIKKFKCGKCGNFFSKSQSYVRHCIQKCQQLAHPNSSHQIFLSDDYLPIENVNKLVKFMQWSISFNILKQKLKQFIRIKNADIVGSYTREDGKIDGLKKLLLLTYQKAVNSIKLTRFCGICRKTYLGQRISCHRYAHNDILTEEIGFIVIRFSQGNFTLGIQETSENQFWSCPCQPNKQFFGKQFISHVLQVHKGVSMHLQIL